MANARRPVSLTEVLGYSGGVKGKGGGGEIKLFVAKNP